MVQKNVYFAFLPMDGNACQEYKLLKIVRTNEQFRKSLATYIKAFYTAVLLQYDPHVLSWAA